MPRLLHRAVCVASLIVAASIASRTVADPPANATTDDAYWATVAKLARALNEEDRVAYRALFADPSRLDDEGNVFDFMVGRVMARSGVIDGFHPMSPPTTYPGAKRPVRRVVFHLANGMPGYFVFALNEQGLIEQFSLFIKPELCRHGRDPKCPEVTKHLADLGAKDDDGSRGQTVPAGDSAVDRVLAEARGAATRSGFWSAMTQAADLCAAAPPDAARRVRAEALALLAARFDDAIRWSSLLTRGFMPDLAPDLAPDPAGGPAAQPDEEIAAYRALLDRLAAGATDPRVESELLYAKALLAAEIGRGAASLPDAQRSEAVRELETITARFGTLECPGSSETVAARAERLADELRTLHVGASAPSIAGRDLDDEPIDLGMYRGRVVVIDFWATFCQPCLALVPHMRDLRDALGDRPVTFLGVCDDADPAMGKRTADRVGMTWPSVWDGPNAPDGPLARAYHVEATGWPSVFVLDGQGRIRHRLHGGPTIERDLEAAIRGLLDEM